MEHDIWSATPPKNDVLKLSDLSEAPENYHEFYDRLDVQVERIPSLKEVLVDETNSRFSESLADVVGRTIIRGHYTPSIRTENDFSDKFDPIESLKIYMYLQLSPNGQRTLATKSKYTSGFCESLDIHDSVSQSTVGRIRDRIEEGVPSWADYFSRVKQDVIIQMQGTEYEDWFAEPPQVTFDGGGLPEVKRISRKLRQYIFPFIKLDRGEGVKYSKDDLLKILAAAGRWGCQPNQAADAMELKPWNHGKDVADSSSLFYRIWPMEKSR